jgi:hypothetical protein
MFHTPKNTNARNLRQKRITSNDVAMMSMKNMAVDGEKLHHQAKESKRALIASYS